MGIEKVAKFIPGLRTLLENRKTTNNCLKVISALELEATETRDIAKLYKIIERAKTYFEKNNIHSYPNLEFSVNNFHFTVLRRVYEVVRDDPSSTKDLETLRDTIHTIIRDYPSYHEGISDLRYDVSENIRLRALGKGE